MFNHTMSGAVATVTVLDDDDNVDVVSDLLARIQHMFIGCYWCFSHILLFLHPLSHPTILLLMRV